jgi:hypothetical protein
MPKHDGSVGAHEVDVLVAIDVPDAAALASGEEIGVRAGAKEPGALVAVDATGDDAAGPFQERFAAVERVELLR